MFFECFACFYGEEVGMVHCKKCSIFDPSQPSSYFHHKDKVCSVCKVPSKDLLVSGQDETTKKPVLICPQCQILTKCIK
jgi:hypothetical protein